MKKKVTYRFIAIFVLWFCFHTNSVFSQTDSHTFVKLQSKGKSLHLKWKNTNKNILIIASEDNPLKSSPDIHTSYIANSEFGIGTKISNGFVVYYGSENSIYIKGLKKGTQYYFTFFEVSANGYIISKTSVTDANNLSSNEKTNPVTEPAAVVTCVCPAIAGITCTLTGTTNTATSVASAAGCPHVGYCDPGSNNSWSSAAGTGTLQYMFSAPVSAATLRANSVNTNDYATVSASGGSGGALSVTGVVCMGVAGLVIGPLSVASSYGGVSWTVNSTGSYTNVTLLNTGAQSGWVSACPTAITAAPLPIELVSLKGVCVEKNIILSWQTASEKNNSYFAIERSFNTEDWEEIGRVAGAGNSNELIKYEFTDNNTIKGTSYYRLRQTDLDKKFKLSELIAVESCKGVVDVMVYPNPAKDLVYVKCSSPISLEIYNILGEKLSDEKLNAGQNKIAISALAIGTYFFKLSDSNTTLQFSKVVVNR